MSTLAVNTITNAAGANTAQINGMTPTADSLQGFRNRIINGDMRIDQRNAGASVTPAGSAYTLDRWRLGNSTGAVMSVQQSTDAPTGFNNSVLCTVVTATTPTADQLLYLQQNIEGYNVADFGFGTAAAQTVTASFWVKSSVTGAMSFSINNGDLTRSYCTTYTVSAANTWEYKTIVIPGDISGTWLTTNGIGLEVHFNFAVGSNYEATANNQWEAGRKYATSSTTDFTTNTAGSTIRFTGVQLEAGSVATPFERRPYGTELALCQRYFELVQFSAAIPSSASTLNLVASTGFANAKRASPTMALVSNNYLYTQSGVAASSAYLANTMGGVAYRACSNSATQQQFSELTSASAEL
jgi:hypothetical protein